MKKDLVLFVSEISFFLLPFLLFIFLRASDWLFRVPSCPFPSSEGPSPELHFSLSFPSPFTRFTLTTQQCLEEWETGVRPFGQDHAEWEDLQHLEHQDEVLSLRP